MNPDFHKRTGDKTLKSLQIIRSMAAISVIPVHVEPIPNFGGFGVDILFVLSGFVIALNRYRFPRHEPASRKTAFRTVPEKSHCCGHDAG